MKAIYTFALIAVGTVLISSTSLRSSEADGRTELALNKSPAYRPCLSYAETNEPADFRFPDALGKRLAPQVRSEVEAPPKTISSPKIELKAPKPNNFVQSEKHPSLEFSGILVQAVRNNPVQLLNPLAPSQYGDGKANTVFNIFTGRGEGLKLLEISF